MQFNHGKGRNNIAVVTNPNGHLAFDREIGIGGMPDRASGFMDFAPKQTRMDGAAHPELLDHTGPDATDLISSYCIAGSATKAGDLHLDRVGLFERQCQLRIGKSATRHGRLVIVPLAQRERLQRV